jgi:hypothetical protein
MYFGVFVRAEISFLKKLGSLQSSEPQNIRSVLIDCIFSSLIAVHSSGPTIELHSANNLL